MNSPVPSSPPQPPKLLDQVARILERQRYALATIATFQFWIRRFILFHDKRHPRELGAAEVGAFLDQLALAEKRPLSEQAAARNALVFLYRELLQQPLGDIPVARLRSGSDRAEKAFGHRPPRLLDQARQILRVRHYGLRTEECYLQWITRFILFYHKRHPRDMGAAEVEQFLTDLAVNGHIAASTQNQALCALLFL